MICGSCGVSNGDAARFCMGCGAQLPTAPPVQAASAGAFIPPSPAAASAPEAAPSSPLPLIGGLGVARMGDRLIATILDSIFLAVVFAIIGMYTAARMGGVTDSGFSLNGVPAALAMGATLLAGFLYYALGEAIAGSTLGKSIAGIQVREKTGARCGMKRSLIRNLLRIVDAIGVYLVGFLIAIFSKTRQRLGDHAAGTVVVERNTPKTVRIFFVIVWFAMIGGGLTGAYVIHRGAPETVNGEFVALPSTIPAASTGRLRAGNFAFVEGNGGPVRPSAVFKPGERVFLKYDIAGFARDAQKAPHLSFQLTAADPAGLAVHQPWTTRFDGPLPRGAPVNGTLGLELPSFAPPGSYKINVKVHDEVNNTDLEMMPVFQVNAPAVTVPQGPEIRDLQLSRSRNGPAETGFEAGTTVYMACSVFGLHFQNDRTSARMSHKVLGPEGQVLLDTPDFLDLSKQEYYRPATYWVPVWGEVTIPSDMKKGIYTDQYSVVDNVTNQSITQEVKLELR
jgi:uncharacterized RDD family membrane protein YckC